MSSGMNSKARCSAAKFVSCHWFTVAFTSAGGNDGGEKQKQDHKVVISYFSRQNQNCHHQITYIPHVCTHVYVHALTKVKENANAA